LAAIQIGGYGFCTGRIVQVASCISEELALEGHDSSVHSRLINSSASSMRGTRGAPVMAEGLVFDLAVAMPMPNTTCLPT